MDKIVHELVTHGKAATKNGELIKDFFVTEPSSKELQQATWGTPDQFKTIPWLVTGICHHWNFLTLGLKK